MKKKGIFDLQVSKDKTYLHQSFSISDERVHELTKVAKEVTRHMLEKQDKFNITSCLGEIVKECNTLNEVVFSVFCYTQSLSKAEEMFMEK